MKRLIRFDWAVKKLLRNKANFEVLEGFLSELTRQNIKIQSILESESNKEKQEDKYNRVDILVENDKGELILVEVQNDNELDYFQRMLYGSAKLITQYIQAGDIYQTIKKVISVNIIYFDLGQGQDYVYKGTTEFYGLHNHDLLQLSEKQKDIFRKETVSAIYPEYYVIRVNQFNDVAKDTLDEWIYFLKNSEIKTDFTAKGLKKANEVLEVMKLSAEDQASYERYLDDLHYKASMAWTMKVESEWEIRKEEREKLLNRMLNKGLNNEQIHDLTGIPIEEIEKLRKSH